MIDSDRLHRDTWVVAPWEPASRRAVAVTAKPRLPRDHPWPTWHMRRHRNCKRAPSKAKTSGFGTWVLPRTSEEQNALPERLPLLHQTVMFGLCQARQVCTSRFHAVNSSRHNTSCKFVMSRASCAVDAPCSSLVRLYGLGFAGGSRRGFC